MTEPEVSVDAALLARAEAIAAERGETVQDVVDRLLRAWLDGREV